MNRVLNDKCKSKHEQLTPPTLVPRKKKDSRSKAVPHSASPSPASSTSPRTPQTRHSISPSCRQLRRIGDVEIYERQRALSHFPRLLLRQTRRRLSERCTSPYAFMVPMALDEGLVRCLGRVRKGGRERTCRQIAPTGSEYVGHALCTRSACEKSARKDMNLNHSSWSLSCNVTYQSSGHSHC